MLDWLGSTYAQVTRTEVAFTAHLYHLWQVHGLDGFVRRAASVTGLPLDPDSAWEPAFEACFYRDVRKAGRGTPGSYSRKRTFDLALFSHEHVVIIEAKAQQGFDRRQLEDFARDAEQVTALTGVERVSLLALASSRCPFTEDEQAVFHGPPLTWRDLAALYDDPVLLRADHVYEDAPSTKSYQAHNEGYRTGSNLVLAHRRGERLWVGRARGLRGHPLAEDVLTGRWRSQRYEVNASSPHPPSSSWFSLDDFVALVDPR